MKHERGIHLGGGAKRAVAVLIATTLSTPVMFAFASNGQQNVSPAAATSPLIFEVATIKPNDSPSNHETISIAPGGSLKATLTVKSLIEHAYGLRDFQISGGPKWIESDKYDIAAKSDDTADPSKLSPAEQDAFIERQKQRLQSLLVDRFHLQFRYEKRELPVYALVVAKGGPKLKTPKAGEVHRLYTQGPGRLACFSTSMAELAEELPNVGVDRIVIDKTGISGNYDFWLKWTPTEALEGTDGSVFTALQEQVGLKLESQKGPVSVFVISNIDRPTAN